MVISSRLRQLTATQGLDGVNWKYELLEMTVTLSSALADSRISYAMVMPPMPAPRITMCAMCCCSLCCVGWAWGSPLEDADHGVQAVLDDLLQVFRAVLPLHGEGGVGGQALQGTGDLGYILDLLRGDVHARFQFPVHFFRHVSLHPWVVMWHRVKATGMPSPDMRQIACQRASRI